MARSTTAYVDPPQISDWEAEFGSAVHALSATIELQQGMADANRDQPELDRIVFRAGVHLGDIIDEPHDVSDELFERLREHYSEAEIVELAYIVALENFRSRFNRTLRVEAQGLYCVLPGHRGVKA